MSVVFLTLLFLTGVVLIVIILIQRGRGGGLAGAFGGLGGQSAFGARAGDTFTRVTIGVATFWILLCILGVAFVGTGTKSRLNLPGSGAADSQPAPTAPAGGADDNSAPTPATPSSPGASNPGPGSSPASPPATGSGDSGAQPGSSG